MTVSNEFFYMGRGYCYDPAAEEGVFYGRLVENNVPPCREYEVVDVNATIPSQLIAHYMAGSFLSFSAPHL